MSVADTLNRNESISQEIKTTTHEPSSLYNDTVSSEEKTFDSPQQGKSTTPQESFSIEEVTYSEPSNSTEMSLETIYEEQDNLQETPEIVEATKQTHLTEGNTELQSPSTPSTNTKHQLVDEPLTYNVIGAISPLFFEIINTKVNIHKQQSTAITMIDNHVENYMLMSSTKPKDNTRTIIDPN